MQSWFLHGTFVFFIYLKRCMDMSMSTKYYASFGSYNLDVVIMLN